MSFEQKNSSVNSETRKYWINLDQCKNEFSLKSHEIHQSCRTSLKTCLQPPHGEMYLLAMSLEGKKQQKTSIST